MKFKFLFLISIACQLEMAAHADEGATGVIDLGELSVTGEVRRPAINWIDSQKSVRENIPTLIKSELDQYESKLLEPAQIKKNESEKKNEQD